MSELDDADLYGDLYGDEQDIVQPPTNESADAQETAPAQSSNETELPKSLSPREENQKSSMTANGHATPQPIQTYSSTSQDYAPRDPGYRSMNQGEQQPHIQSSMQIVERQVRPSEMKEEGKMFIGGLNWDTTDEGLRKYFEQFGKVEACTIMRDATGRSRCFAFLTFEDPASVNAVMVREHYLDGKVIDPKRAIPRQEHQRAVKLFIGGLAGTVTSDSMREFFSQFGKVIDSTVMLDRDTGRSKGFGFVSFENVNVEPILGFGKLEIDGKLIDVKLAQPRHQRDNISGGGGGGGGYREESYVAQGTGGNFNGGQTGGYTTPAIQSNGVQPAGNTPFDPQALANLYTRMFQHFGGMNSMGSGMGGSMGGMSGMNGMAGMSSMGSMGMMGSNMDAMGMGGGSMNRMGGMGSGMVNAMGGGMGMGNMAGGQMGRMGGAMGAMRSGPPIAPRGLRGAPAGQQGGVGPQRVSQRSQGYHPYQR